MLPERGLASDEVFEEEEYRMVRVENDGKRYKWEYDEV